MRGPVEAEPHEQHLEGVFFLPSQIFGSSDEVWFLLWWLILCKRLLIIIHCKVLLVSEINYLQSKKKTRRGSSFKFSIESTIKRSLACSFDRDDLRNIRSPGLNSQVSDFCLVFELNLDYTRAV